VSDQTFSLSPGLPVPPSIRFGTDGWRGVIAKDFTFENLRRVAGASAVYFRDYQKSDKPILIGYDRRFLSPEFAREVAHVFRAHGLAVKIARTPMTTPSLSVMVAHHSAAWGVMITASHNPALYNGFKIKSAQGCSAPPHVTAEIERRLPASVALDPAKDEKPFETFDFLSVYEGYLRKHLNWPLWKKANATVVFDPLYGVGAGIPDLLLRKTKIRRFSIHTAHDPMFGGLHPEPIEAYLGELRAEVRKRRAIVGIATDGDADRLGIVDDLGRYLTPHQVFPLLVLHAVEFKKWRGKIVQSVSLGALAERIATAYKLPFEELPVGFKHVAEKMLKEDILAGGEESGGYAFRGTLPERDGLLCGLMFLEMCIARGKRPSQLLKEMESRFGAARFHRVDISLEAPITDKTRFVEKILRDLPKEIVGTKIAEKRTSDGLKIFLEGGSWVLLRPSGTEPLVRTYAETGSASKTKALLQWAQSVVREHL
jgi:phosphomannomutase